MLEDRMKKTNKEYAEKLAKDYVSDFTNPIYKEHGYAKEDFINGYLKAIEENAVPELIEALREIDNRLKLCMNQGIDVTEAYDSFYQDIVSEALKKATS